MESCNLSGGRCRPCEGGVPPLAGDAAQDMLRELKGWALEGDRLVRTFVFGNHYETMAFVNAVAWVSHRQDHHPELLVGYKDCRVSYWTHAIGGLSENDFICAAKLDHLLEL